MNAKESRKRPRLPNMDYELTLSHILGVEGPDEISDLAERAADEVRKWLIAHGVDGALLSRLMFESAILPFMFEARRIGERRGVAKENSMFAGLYPEQA